MIAQWGSIVFSISANDALLFQDLKLNAGAETEDLESGKQKYASYKNGKALKLTMTAVLNAALGTKVRDTVLDLQHAAQRGTDDYLIVGREKLYPFKLMLTEANAQNVLISPLGEWVSAEVALTFAQSSEEWIYGQAEEETAPWIDTGGGGSAAVKKNVTAIAMDEDGEVSRTKITGVTRIIASNKGNTTVISASKIPGSETTESEQKTSKNTAQYWMAMASVKKREF